MKAFLKFVEIQTKVASVFPFMMGTLMALYLEQNIDGLNLILMLVSLICIDMATTGYNHLFDYKRALLKTGYHYEQHNPISSGELKVTSAQIGLMLLVGMGAIAGILLVLRTDMLILILGGLAFGVGLGYSMGPLPLSRTILGELFSGVFMGGLITFISAYIHFDAAQIIRIYNIDQIVTLWINFSLVLPILMISIPLIFLISNIMLANNICDMSEDFINKRYTLPISIGLVNSKRLYFGLVVGAYLALLIGMILKILPFQFALVDLTIPVIWIQTQAFLREPVKSKTFKMAVKNFILFAMAMVLSMILALWM